MADDDLTFPDVPRVALDRRIADLMAAAEAFRQEEAGLLALAAAIQSIAVAPGLDPAAARAIESTTLLTGASSVSLVVLDDRGEQRTRHGGSPLGRSAVDPPDEAVLIVPVQGRDRTFGELRLRGEGFSPADVHVAEAIAATTAAVIEHDRLLEEARRMQRWATAANELVARLLDDPTMDAVHVMTDRLMELAEAEPGYIAFLSPDEGTVAMHGLGRARREREPDVLPLHDTFVAQVGRSAGPVDLSAEAARAMSRVVSDLDADGPVLGIPVPGEHGPMGVLVLRRARDAPAFIASDAAMAASFVEQISRAMRIRRTLRDPERRVAATPDGMGH